MDIFGIHMNSHSKLCGCRGFDPHRKQCFLLFDSNICLTCVLRVSRAGRRVEIGQEGKKYVDGMAEGRMDAGDG